MPSQCQIPLSPVPSPMRRATEVARRIPSVRKGKTLASPVRREGMRWVLAAKCRRMKRPPRAMRQTATTTTLLPLRSKRISPTVTARESKHVVNPSYLSSRRRGGSNCRSNVSEHGPQITPECCQSNNYCNGNQTSDQTIFDCRRAFFVFPKFH
jgi:hypothetical protein